MEEKTIKTLGMVFDVFPEDFREYDIEDLELSARSLNRLRQVDVDTIENLLLKSEDEIREVRGLGGKSYTEIISNVKKFLKKQTVIQQESQEYKDSQELFRMHQQEICEGKFEWYDCLGVDEWTSDVNQKMLSRYKLAQEVLGVDLAKTTVFHTESILPILKMLKEYAEADRREMKLRNKLTASLEKMPCSCKKKRVKSYLCGFLKTKEVSSELCSQIDDEATFETLVRQCDVKDFDTFELVKNFIHWAGFDLHKEIEDLFNKLYKDSRNRKVVEMRSRGVTLETIGKEIGVSRERIRQIEAKERRKFLAGQKAMHFLSKFSCVKDGCETFTQADFEEYFPEWAQHIFYFFKTGKSDEFYYMPELDVVMIGDESVESSIQAYLDTIPDVFQVSELENIIGKAEERCGIPAVVIEQAIKDAYKISGSVYHRFRLPMKTMYCIILNKYYANGIRAYDDETLEEFRKYVYQEFGDVKLPQNNRAITARISDVGILCGRGMYRPKKTQYISPELLQKIEDYIGESSTDVFLMNTLFSVFEAELLTEGVDNKYYLQGILHETLGDKYTFTRDYLSKPGAATALYHEVVNFIRQSEYPVSKEQIRKEFPGITDSVMGIATSDNSILNYFGEYFHVSHLQITEAEKRALYNTAKEVLSDRQEHHVKDIYEYAEVKNREVLLRNSVLWPFSLFSLLAYLFEDKFNFERPYIAGKGIKIEHPYDRIKEFICSNEIVVLSDIGEMAKEMHYSINSILDFVNSFNDTHFLLDDKNLIDISRVGITEADVPEIESAILSEISGCTPIARLRCYHSLRSVNVPWSEWLLYSVLKKWSNKIDVAVTNIQFRLAMPLVGPKGCINENVLEEYNTVPKEKVIIADNLDNLDDIISDYIGDDMESWDEI